LLLLSFPKEHKPKIEYRKVVYAPAAEQDAGKQETEHH
jgi:hypothetical protein